MASQRVHEMVKKLGTQPEPKPAEGMRQLASFFDDLENAGLIAEYLRWLEGRLPGLVTERNPDGSPSTGAIESLSAAAEFMETVCAVADSGAVAASLRRWAAAWEADGL